MAFDDPIQVNFDIEQPRTVKDRNLVLAQGSYEGQGGRVLGWDLSRSTGVAVDRATFTAFLEPYQQSEAWYTTTSGVYARSMVKSAWTLSETAKWTDDVTGLAGDSWLYGTSLTADSSGITTATWGKNRGWYIAYLDFNTRGEENCILECGWSATASTASGVAIRIFSSGRVTIYKDGDYRGGGTLSNDRSTAQQWSSFIVMPGRGRELMFIPSQGTGFTFEFPELQGDASPEIIPADKFWFKCPRATGQTMKLQFAPLTFAEEGVLIAQQSYFAQPPALADTDYPIDIYHDLAYDSGTTTAVSASLVEVSSIATTFVPDGVKSSAFFRFDLTGGGEYTPTVYAGLAGYDLDRGFTNGDSTCDLLDATTDRQLRIGETPDSHGAEVHALGIARLTDAGLVDPIGHANRPFSITCDGKTLFEGITLPASIEGGFSEDCYAVKYEVHSLWKLLEDYQFRYPVPLDGASFQEAIEFIVKAATGLPDSKVAIEDPGITISSEGAQASGAWSTQIQAGDRASDWVERLFRNYCGNWYYDFRPDWSSGGTWFVAISPTGLGTTTAVTLWGTTTEAIAQLVSEGVSAGNAAKFHRHRLWSNYQEHGINPEANEVRVTGMNPRNGQPFQSYVRDASSQDPTLAVSSRPENWVGYPLHYTILEPGLTSQDDVDDAATLIAERVTPKRRMASFDSTLIRLSATGRFLWKPDRVVLKNVYDGEDVTIRLSGHETDFDCEDPDIMHRPTSYFGEIVSGTVAWRGSLRASNLEHAALLARERARNPQTFGGGLFAARIRNGTMVTTP